jgi:hypothetical protein
VRTVYRAYSYGDSAGLTPASLLIPFDRKPIQNKCRDIVFAEKKKLFVNVDNIKKAADSAAFEKY